MKDYKNLSEDELKLIDIILNEKNVANAILTFNRLSEEGKQYVRDVLDEEI